MNDKKTPNPAALQQLTKLLQKRSSPHPQMTAKPNEVAEPKAPITLISEQLHLKPLTANG